MPLSPLQRAKRALILQLGLATTYGLHLVDITPCQKARTPEGAVQQRDFTLLRPEVR